MLFGLERLESAIASEAIPEAQIYRDERLYHRPRRAKIPRGALQCPICGTRAQRFLSFGLTGRRNAQCPECGSLERHRMLWFYLARHTDLAIRRYDVLHTAPEPCVTDALRRLPNLRIRSVDRFNPFADDQADLTDLPYARDCFDVVLSSHVLEHIRDDGAAIAELARVLRPGGWAAIMVPYDPARPETDEGRHLDSPAVRLARFGHPYHYRIYGADFTARLADAGFRVSVVSSRRLLTPHQRRRYRINRNYLFLCTPRAGGAGS